MAEDATIDIRLSGNAGRELRKLDSRFDRLSGSARRFGGVGERALRGVGRAAGWAGGKLALLGRGAVRWLARMAKMAALVGAAFAGWQIAQGVRMNAQLEQYNTSLTVLYKSSARAHVELARMIQFSTKTPFMFSEVIQGGVQLKAFGLDIQRWMPVVGDTAAAFGKDLGEVARAIGLLSVGATGEGVESFRRMGVNLREVMGLKWAKSGQLITPIAKAMPVLEAYLKKRFGGMMKKQSGTGAGLWSTLLGNVQLMRADITSGVFENLKDKMKRLIGWLDKLATSPGWQRLKQSFTNVFGGALDTLERLLKLFMKVHGQTGSIGAALAAVWTEVEPAVTAALTKAFTFAFKTAFVALKALVKASPLAATAVGGGALAALLGPSLLAAGAASPGAVKGLGSLASRGAGGAAGWLGAAPGAMARMVGSRGAALPYALETGAASGQYAAFQGSSGALGALSAGAAGLKGLFVTMMSVAAPLAVAYVFGYVGQRVLGRQYGEGKIEARAQAHKKSGAADQGWLRKILLGPSMDDMRQAMDRAIGRVDYAHINKGLEAAATAQAKLVKRAKDRLAAGKKIFDVIMAQTAAYKKLREAQEKLKDLAQKTAEALAGNREAFAAKFFTPAEAISAQEKRLKNIRDRLTDLAGVKIEGTREEQAHSLRANLFERYRLTLDLQQAGYRLVELQKTQGLLERKKLETLRAQKAEYAQHVAMLDPDKLQRLRGLRKFVGKSFERFGWLAGEDKRLVMPEFKARFGRGGIWEKAAAVNAGMKPPAAPPEDEAVVRSREMRAGAAKVDADVAGFRDAVEKQKAALVGLLAEQKNEVVAAVKAWQTEWAEVRKGWQTDKAPAQRKPAEIKVGDIDVILELDTSGDLKERLAEAIKAANVLTVDAIMEALRERMNAQTVGAS